MPKEQKFCRSTELVAFNWIRTHYTGCAVYPVVLILLKAKYIKIILERWNISSDRVAFPRCLGSKFITVTHKASNSKYQYIPACVHGSMEVSTAMGDNRWELKINNYKATLAIGLTHVEQIQIMKYQLVLYQKIANSYGTASYHCQKTQSVTISSLIKGKRVKNGDIMIIRVKGRQLTVHVGNHDKLECLLDVTDMIEGVYRLSVGLFNDGDSITIKSYRQI